MAQKKKVIREDRLAVSASSAERWRLHNKAKAAGYDVDRTTRMGVLQKMEARGLLDRKNPSEERKRRKLTPARKEKMQAGRRRWLAQQRAARGAESRQQALPTLREMEERDRWQAQLEAAEREMLSRQQAYVASMGPHPVNVGMEVPMPAPAPAPAPAAPPPQPPENIVEAPIERMKYARSDLEVLGWSIGKAMGRTFGEAIVRGLVSYLAGRAHPVRSEESQAEDRPDPAPDSSPVQ